MSGPADASLSGEGFRFYRWEPAEGGEATDVLSVTSIRKLCGTSYNLVNWQLANIADAALGTMKRTVIGPRGGVKEVRTLSEYPSFFARRYMEAEGEQAKIDELRKWLRDQADAPRNIAAARGTIVHEAIEKNVAWDRIERPYVEDAMLRLSARDRKKINGTIQDEDVLFVRHAVRQYWNMRSKVPFVIITREPQIFNLTAGYAGSADALVWFLPDGVAPPSKTELIDFDLVKGVGGYLALIDWKTSKDVYTDHVVQAHAYMAGEFIGSNGVIDQRLTGLLQATMVGGLVHIRPDKWGIHMFDFSADVLRAFLGSVAFARFLAKYPDPKPIFTREHAGSAPEEE